MDIIFELVLFATVFSFLCCLQYRNAENPQNANQPGYQPNSKESESRPENLTPCSIVLVERKRKTNKTLPISNGTIIIPSKPQTVPEKHPLPPLPENATLQSLKNYVKTHQLQAVIANKLGNQSSRWRKVELQSALLNLLAS